ncbi:MAG TPA: hypothetical protein PKD28_01625 [Candidatus Saccharibacteria bacterium]|nr:hypothetical protein [Candidatus Saccharibacteria bacterium]
MLLYSIGTFLLVSLALGAIIAATYFTAITIIRRPVPIDLATKQITLQKVPLDYRTCAAIFLQVSVGKQVGYSLLFSFPDGRHWTYRLTDNHADTDRVRANKQAVTAMIDEMSKIPQTLHDVVEVNRFLGSLFGRQLISLGSAEAKQYLHVSRHELNGVFPVLKRHR